MNTPSNNEKSRGLSADTKFWCYLTPFLSASLVFWGYAVWWVLQEAPEVIPRIVASWQSGLESEGHTASGSKAVDGLDAADG